MTLFQALITYWLIITSFFIFSISRLKKPKYKDIHFYIDIFNNRMFAWFVSPALLLFSIVHHFIFRRDIPYGVNWFKASLKDVWSYLTVKQ